MGGTVPPPSPPAPFGFAYGSFFPRPPLKRGLRPTGTLAARPRDVLSTPNGRNGSETALRAVTTENKVQRGVRVLRKVTGVMGVTRRERWIS